ncbi:hypothetical protein conserved [Leishmania donovani]|uniref:BRCT domain-containing protein n=3 Tax=Leishmania donovani species complex TaxID=38574 RepID=A4I4N7_LEIIN|nr:conserved hypothetical protein [Leishmania infantum JPCM5]CAC9509388.1 hypothetical_protein_-_conserved [Leishmania infantum]CAJ1990665.1 hypothetical protein conserved [Leishmania donovani]CAM69750.1 conserved hypothetical protein [Leishmania infantum JPCM5]SUZ43701.1 hypothetical_protein_-_conserved [Leishmania infantum]VDZ46518.1 hypothetical_protein_conserved [Leishmania donovani]|eukprot:XP_001466706.1 conserved hypothetical protein [Leishmania infantum JPCM5]
MEVPATRPEVTTTGIYGEELNVVRQHLLRSELCWCGDLTSRTQVLVVGSALCAASRKLSVARMRGLPCVSIEWATDGACAMESTHRFDIGHGLTGKEVCTTSLNHLERGRVQAVCGARRATYNSMLTRHCELLVASTAALSSILLSSLPTATSNDKVRFARKHGIPIIAMEEFVLLYATEQPSRHHLPLEDAVPGRVAHDASLLRASDRGSRASSSNGHTDVACEPKHRTGCSSTGASAGSLSSSNDNGAPVCGSVRPSALPVRSATSTLRSSVASRGRSITSVRGSRHTEGTFRGCDSIMLSAVQPSLSSSQLMPTASTAACASPPGMSRRPLADEFSDVVAYCSPPHRLTTQQHDLLSGMGVTVSPQLTPFTTHVLVLGDGVEECLYPRPGLQVVSWQWVTQCRLEQRRLSCLGFRVQCVFRPVLTFTGLAPADRHALLLALQRSGLPGKVQEALVLGGSGDGRYGSASSLPLEPEGNPYLPCNTTHLVVPRGQLLSSQKVAALAQHHYKHSSRPRPHSSAPLTSASACRLVGVDWVYRSIQQAQWLDADLFTLAIPTPEAFTFVKTVRANVARTAVPHSGQNSQESLSVRLRISQPSSASATATNLAMQTPALRQPSPSRCRCPRLQDAIEGGVEGGLGKPAVGGRVVEDREEEEEAASSQQPNTDVGRANDTASPPPPPHRARDDDDEEAGGESPLAAAAVRSALQAIHSTSPHPSSAPSRSARSPSATGKQEGGAPYARDDLAVTLHHHADPPLSSYAYLTTQCTPGFESLLGELEAAPPGTLFGASAVHASLYPRLLACTTANASAVSAPSGGDREGQVQRSGSCSATAPPTGADLCVEQRALLRRTSAQPHMIHQQQQLLGRTMSDESQVIFYQMALDEDGGIAAAPPAALHSNPYAITEAVEDRRRAKAAMPSASCVAGAVTHVYPRSASTSAVFLITKDALKSDFDAFVDAFPHVQRTSKPEECTHFITAKPSKTEQFLCCLAAGRWILTPAYVTACAQAGYLVSEAPFEWSAEVAASLGCRSSVASLARGCRVQREASQLPFASWQVRVCCTNSARTASFLRVLRNGGCTSLEGATAAEVIAAFKKRGSAPPSSTELVLADDAVFSERELEDFASRPASIACPIMRLEYLVQFLCAPDTPRSEMNLLHWGRPRKRSRTEAAATE